MNLKASLKEIFNYDDFREGQAETIESILTNKETLSILPTGTGKSLCYQLPSYLLPGTTVIVSPLISLMDDQVQQLKLLGEKKAIAINSQLDFVTKKTVLAQLAQYKFVFVSPETLMQPAVQQALQSVNLNLFVVDEAHCISQWGIDFRPEYEQLGRIIELLKIPKVVALTATATDKVIKDIKNQLFTRSPKIVRHSVNRPNIAYEVVETLDKTAFLLEFLNEQKGPGIIYFSSKRQAEETSRLLNQAAVGKSAFYHGDLTNQERTIIQQQFLSDQLTILCATSAFGMGINKGNIRFIIHYHLPNSIESFLQESGRSGRDGQQSLSVVLYTPGDENLHYFLQGELAAEIQQFATLKDQTFSELKAVQEQLSELQQKWLWEITSEQRSFANLLELLEERSQEKQRQLSAVRDYLKVDTCRRNFLLAYFKEPTASAEPPCCDNCGNYGKLLLNYEKILSDKLRFSKNWQEQLEKMFVK
ncbi:RecQ family ATP-dependent DNA helicase [Vagococcus salmoninarum]|uniref:RecQ family ATP-dependent DNA helicase n=1 Tax=Vagococcus salmoninarum TaxID=2739 RepID=UPI0028D3E2D9|nr:ATP-dependent DNA helicase RecQ [Vagococcus salmoninarum]